MWIIVFICDGMIFNYDIFLSRNVYMRLWNIIEWKIENLKLCVNYIVGKKYIYRVIDWMRLRYKIIYFVNRFMISLKKLYFLSYIIILII